MTKSETAFRLRWRIPPREIVSRLRIRSARALDKVAVELTSNIVHSLTEAYPPASEPGEPPHLRTGQLMGSVDWSSPDETTRRITASAPYAHFLEFGTEKMDERPFMRPQLEEVGDLIIKHFDKV